MDTDLQLIEKFVQSHTPEAVRIFERFSYAEMAAFLNNAPTELGAAILTNMNSYLAAKCLEHTDLDLAVELSKKINAWYLELLLRQAGPAFQNDFLSRLPPAKADKIRVKLQYASGSVGAMMNPKVFSLQARRTVKEAEKIIKGKKVLQSSDVYVTDSNKKYLGIVRLHDLLTSDSQLTISEILVASAPKFLADESVHNIANLDVWKEYRSVGVVDRSGLLIGSLQYEDIKKSGVHKYQESKQQIVETANALGELYRIGLTGLLQSTGKLND